MAKRIEEIEQEWDEQYGGKSVPVIDATRVEQGEYAVNGIDRPIGTYNVQQCSVIHIINGNQHGLVHIDGHTETASLEAFIEDLGLKEESSRKNVKIQILGSSSDIVMGLNDKNLNLSKVQTFLEKYFPEQNAAKLIEGRDQINKDFVIDGAGKLSKGIASGTRGNSRAMHILQELKRRDGYIGTYPITRADDRKDNNIYLDKRAIVQLTKYQTDPEKEARNRNKLDNNNYAEYDASIALISDQWTQARNALKSAVKNDNISSDEINKAIDRMPLYIGDDSAKLNQALLESINTAKTISDLDAISFSKNTVTINQAIEFCRIIDPALQTENVMQQLTKQYNVAHGTDFDTKHIGQKNYGAEIDVPEFVSALAANSPKLNGLMILNSQGGVSFVDSKTPYTVGEAIKAAQAVDPKYAKLLQQKVSEYNKAVATQEIEIDDKTRKNAIIKELESKGIELTRKDKLLIDKAREDLVLKKHSSIDVKEFQQAVDQRCESFIQNTLKGKLIDNGSEYARIQDEFLKDARIQGLSEFSSIELGAYLAAPGSTKSIKTTPPSKSQSAANLDQGIENAFTKRNDMDYQYETNDINAIGTKILAESGQNLQSFTKALGVGVGELDAVTTLQQKKLLLDGNNINKILGVYNTGGNHWVSFVINKDQANDGKYNVYVKDSFGRARNDLKGQIERAFGVDNITNYKEHGISEQRFGDVSCGVFALENLTTLAGMNQHELNDLENKNDFLTQAAVQNKRITFAAKYVDSTHETAIRDVTLRNTRQGVVAAHQTEQQNLTTLLNMEGIVVEVRTRQYLTNGHGYDYVITCPNNKLEELQPELANLFDNSAENVEAISNDRTKITLNPDSVKNIPRTQTLRGSRDTAHNLVQVQNALDNDRIQREVKEEMKVALRIEQPAELMDMDKNVRDQCSQQVKGIFLEKRQGRSRSNSLPGNSSKIEGLDVPKKSILKGFPPTDIKQIDKIKQLVKKSISSMPRRNSVPNILPSRNPSSGNSIV